MSDIFDKTDVFEEQIAESMRELQVNCSVAGLPMFATVVVANDDKHTEYKSCTVFASTNKSLTENRIGSLLMRLNGFENIRHPEYIRKAIRDLGEYLDAIEERNAINACVDLENDMINDMHMIANGGDEISFKNYEEDDFIEEGEML